MTARPFSPVTAVRSTPVAVFLSVRLVPRTAPPDWSFTVTFNVANCCADTLLAETNTKKNAAPSNTQDIRRTFPPLLRILSFTDTSTGHLLRQQYSPLANDDKCSSASA